MPDRTFRWVAYTVLMLSVDTAVIRHLGWTVWLPIVITQVCAYVVGLCDGIEAKQ